MALGSYESRIAVLETQMKQVVQDALDIKEMLISQDKERRELYAQQNRMLGGLMVIGFLAPLVANFLFKLFIK